MASNPAPGLQYISDIANATTLTDSRAFNAFCVEELQTAKTFIQKNLPYITLDTVLFHAYFVLEYRIDHTQVSINDKLIETAFDFLDTFVPAYTQAFRNNEKNCLHRCLSLFVYRAYITPSCISYLDNGEKLRMPKTLSENALLAILKCLQSLLSVVDAETLSSFLTLLTTPAEEKDVARWATTSFLPVLSSSPSLQYLQSTQFRSPFTILFFDLNNLLSHASHEIVYRTLCCIELLLLTTGDHHILPAIPSLLSTLSIQVRVDSLMTWRERTLILLLFGHTLSLLPANSVSKTPSVSEVVSNWFLQCSTTSTQNENETPPIPTQNENETLPAFQTRRVLSELPQRVPPLLANLLDCCAAPPHPNVQLALLHGCFLLLPAATRFFDRSVTPCCDALIHALYHPSVLVRRTAHTLSQAIFHTLSGSPEGRHVLVAHLASLLVSLPSSLCLQRERDGLRSIRTVRGYFAMLAAPLTEVLTLQDDSFTQLRSFYDTLKQCLQIDSISTVAVAVDSSVELSANASADLAESTTSSSSELTTDSPTATSPKEMTTPRLYRITHHFLSEAEAAELLACLTEVFVHCGEMHAELCLWLLADCLDGSAEAALLLPVLLRRDNSAVHEVVSSLLEFLHRTTQPPNARLLLRTLTGIIIAIGAVTTYQSSLLYSLFFYRSLDPHDGLITHALLRLCRHYQLDSIEALAARNSDYLMDAVLIQLRVATTLRSNAVEDQLSFLAAVWRDKTAVDPHDPSLFPFAQDSVQICTGLLASKPLHVLQVLVPIVGLLLHSVPNQKQETPSLVDRFFKRREFRYEEETPSQEVSLLQQILSQVKFYLSSPDRRVQNAILTMVSHSLQSRVIPNAFPFFSPFLPFMISLLQSPNSPLFLPSLECSLAICSLDSVACQEKVTTILWPAVRNALEDCDDWRRELGNAEQAARLRVGVMRAVCASYRDSDLFESVSEEMVDWLEAHLQFALCECHHDNNDNDTPSTNTLYYAWLHAICRYNLSYRSWMLETHLNPPLQASRNAFMQSVLSPVWDKHDNKRSAESRPEPGSRCGSCRSSRSPAGRTSDSCSCSRASSTPLRPSARASSRTPPHYRSTSDPPSRSASSNPPSAARAGGSRTGPSTRSSATTGRSGSPTGGRKCCLRFSPPRRAHCRGRR